MEEVIIIIITAILSILVYNIVSSLISIRKLRHAEKKVKPMYERMAVLYKRNDEMILHVLELRLKGDNKVADLLQENIDRDLEEMQKINDKIDEIIFASK